ncbi:hypothetical protein [Aureivirga sp. CE67]|uniref:hypothetical protein n=1 Tax=Aureivirga sp. CE67 TaxID=1788983 RepID=UPI0018CB2454|nr:hypothetical protein [Aureivirga sp. CE67]
MRTTLYGYIEEMDFWNENVRKLVKTHNNNIISSLKPNDNWPPVSKEMFSITNNIDELSPNLEYSGRIIHFGVNLKSVENEIDEWIEKFESLLSQLIWKESKVHFQTEYCELKTLRQSLDLQKYNVNNEEKLPELIKKKDWKFNSTWNK